MRHDSRPWRVCILSVVATSLRLLMCVLLDWGAHVSCYGMRMLPHP